MSQNNQESIVSTVNCRGKRFIEEQFPINRLSKESYAERKAGIGQTLTGIGKWWGRKPLILVRATLLGLLMPASEDKLKDASVFLKVLMMDDEATWLRLKIKLSAGWVYQNSEEAEKENWFYLSGKYPKWNENIAEGEQIRITKRTFLALLWPLQEPQPQWGPQAAFLSRGRPHTQLCPCQLMRRIELV